MGGLGKVDGYIAKEGKDGRDRLLPMHPSSFNDINMWYKQEDPARTSHDACAWRPWWTGHLLGSKAKIIVELANGPITP